MSHVVDIVPEAIVLGRVGVPSVVLLQVKVQLLVGEDGPAGDGLLVPAMTTFINRLCFYPDPSERFLR